MSNQNIVLIENGSTLTLEQQQGALDKRITYYIDEEIEAKRMSKIKFAPDNLEVVEEEFQESDRLLNTASSEEDAANLYREEKREGKVLMDNYKRYYRFIGGTFVTFYLFIVFVASQFALSYSDKLISMWVNLEPKISVLIKENQTTTQEYESSIKTRDQYLNIYTMLIVAAYVLTIMRSYSSFFFCMNGARKLHKAMVSTLLNAYMYFFDDHFIGNIINRLSKDFQAIDEYIPFLVFECYRTFFFICGAILLVVSVNWIFLIPAAFLLIKFFFVQKFYIGTGRSLRRLEASTRSPIIGYLNSTLEGLAIVRAAQQEETLKMEFDRHQNLFTSVSFTNQTTVRFFVFMLDFFGAIFILGITLKFLILPEGVLAGDVGLAISQSILLSQLLQHAVKELTEVESVMTSVERVLEYADVPTENTSGKQLPHWPTEGIIRYNDVSLTYKTDGNTVLHNISFEIEGKKKVGIVGRTGAGKSSIISTLFRLYDFDGQILIDNENTKTLSLDFLRSIISIIPQDPVLFSGTIRTNIDPFHKYADADIWSALEKVHMKSTVGNLNQTVSDLTSNYSSGQKQLLCLARAVVQKNKIIVLDEATANLDPETDQLIQKTVQECFKDCTVLIIAHRLHSVMACDKIIVLDAGKIVEFDEPTVLMGNANGALYKMVREENKLDAK